MKEKQKKETKEITAIAFPVPVKTDGTVPVMSSMDIAALTGKNHADVLRDIRNTLEAANIDASKFAGIYKDAYDREKPCYFLPKFELDLVVSGYSVPYRAAIIKRWHELEAEKAVPQISRREQILKELADMDRGTIAVGVVDAIRPIHEYGSLAGNGKKRIGFRRAAWVADRRSRLEDALIIHREIREMDQIEFNLGLEGGDS